MQFTPTAAPKGKHIYLEIADVHDYAHVTLNGKEVGARSFQPYRWDVTSDLKKGANDLKIEVYANVSQTPSGAPSAANIAAPAAGSASAPSVGAAGAAGRRRQAGGRGPAGATTTGALTAVAPPASAGGGGRGAAAATATSGLLGSVKLVAY